MARHDDHLIVSDMYKRDTKNHEMTVLRDDGVYRHIAFGQPGTSSYCFSLVTWPGHLSITGDMGAFTFARLADMFDFFRKERINPGYWQEKIQAGASYSGAKAISEEWSEEAFEKAIKARFEDWAVDIDDKEKIDELKSRLQDEVIDQGGSESSAVEAVYSFNGEDFDFSFIDFEEDCNVYQTHYIWCLNAIVDGIKQYDAFKAEAQNFVPKPNAAIRRFLAFFR